MRKRTQTALMTVATGLAALGGAATSASAQAALLSIEFNQDDQAGFDIWPEAIVAPTTTAVFTTDPVATSGMTTVTVTTSPEV